MKIIYNPKLKERARHLRNNSTKSEVLLWSQLKLKQLMGYQLNRQRPIGHYIVDFYCPRLKLIIEIDGDSHLDKSEYDTTRDHYFQAIGFNVLHFSDYEVKAGLESVLERIEQWIYSFQTSERCRPPLQKGESGGFKTSKKRDEF